jgi:hypothetical protein
MSPAPLLLAYIGPGAGFFMLAMLVFGVVGAIAILIAWVVSIVYSVRTERYFLLLVCLFFVPVGVVCGVIVLLTSDGGRIGGAQSD